MGSAGGPMKKILLFPGYFFLAATILTGALFARASTPSGWYQVEKLTLEFHELLRVELQGVVRESSDPANLSMTVPFLQTLHYYSSISRIDRRAFPSVAEIRAWINREVCTEIHEQVLKPLRETGNIGIQPIKSKVRPISVTAIGTRVETKDTPLNDTVYCKAEGR